MPMVPIGGAWALAVCSGWWKELEREFGGTRCCTHSPITPVGYRVGYFRLRWNHAL